MRRVTTATFLGLAIFLTGTTAGVFLRPHLSRLVHSRPAAVPPLTGESAYGLPDEAVGTLSLVILAGQSNMSGYGPLDSHEPADPRIFLFGNDYRWRLAREPLDDDHNQVDLVSRDGNAGVGPGLAFARALLVRRPDLRIGLIPCAKSASSIAQWQRNLNDLSLYGSCLKRARAAGLGGTIAAILVFQGEADALDPVAYPERTPSGARYAAEFSSFIGDFRSDVGSPELPLVFAQLGSTDARDAFINWDLVKSQQASLATALPCAAMIATDDLPLLDGLHFTTHSYHRIGERFASALDELLARPAGCGAVESDAYLQQ